MNSNLKIETIVPAVYLCYGAKDARSHRLTFVGQADSPWVGQSASLNALGTFPVSTAPAIGLYQPFPLDGGEWTISCPDDGEPVSFAGQLQSEFTAAPYPISFELGHYLREFLGRRNPIGAPLIGDEVTAEAQVVSAYTQKLLKDVEVQWFVGGKPAGRIDTNDSGWSKFSYTFTTVGEQSITAKVFNPYDGTTVEHSFPIKVYAESPWKQADLKVNGVPVTWRSPVLLRRGQANEVTVKVESAIAKTLRLALINEEGLNIVAVPADTVWQQPDPVSGEFKWTLTSNEQKSGRVRLVIYSQEVAQPWEHDGRVLAGDLADEVEVRIDGKPVTSGVNFFFRGRPGVITLVSKEGSSVTEGLAVTLTRVITSGLDEADLVSSPGFGVPTPDHRWSVTGSNKSGTFQLIFTCQGIAVPLTVALNALLSTDLNDEAEVRIGGVEIPAEGQLFFRGEAQALTVVAKPGSPLGRLPLALRWIKGVEPEKFTCVPALGTYTPDHSWSITGPADKSGTFQFELDGEGMSTALKLPECALLSKNFAEEGTFLVDGEELSESTVFTRGVARTLTLVPNAGSPVANLTKSLQWNAGTGLVKADLTCTPALDLPTKLNSWQITGSATKSGTFQLKLVGLGGVTLGRLAVCMLLSRNLEADVTVKLDGAVIPAEGKVFIRGRPRTLTLEPKAGSPVANLPMSLRWGSGTGLVAGDFQCVPALGQETKPHSWCITGPAAKSGTFHFTVAGPSGVTLTTLALSTVLSANLREEADLLFAGQPLPAQGVVLLRGQSGTFSLVPKATSPIAGKPLAMKYAGGTLPVSDVTCQPPFGQSTTQYQWAFTGPANRSGTFIAEVGYGQDASLVMEPVVVLSPKLNDELSAFEITPQGGIASPVDLEGEGLTLTKDSASLTLKVPASSPLIGRTVAFKWEGDAENPSVVLPAPFVVQASTVVQIRGVENPASLKRHQLCLDYGGAVTASWTFRYLRGLPSSGLSIWCDGVNHGANSLLLKFDKNYELSIRPKTEDSVFVGWKCKFVKVAEQGVSIELLSSAEFLEIGSPATGGAKATIRARDDGGFNYRKIYMDVQIKDFGVLKVPIEIV
ncbi:hypothetical protein [Pseudomonas migulae]|uniref:Ig-like domain (Group 3) n=1 Tax=Pseudomonas migulae TaxID=78543 RepID=A0ABY8N2Z8_9PSED|nr:hypothetical protein [Pseudomonas migulae]WGK93241.1 hypothetical protein MOQ58_13955 [Pseudomonas migulae]